MRPTKRLIALGLATALLAACGHKDKDAPLAFVPADTPYVFANIEAPSDDVRAAAYSQWNLQLPGQVAQLKTLADSQEQVGHTNNANLLRALVKELDGKKAEDVVTTLGMDPKGKMAFYGMGLAPVLRADLADPKAFDAFVDRMEAAYGQKFDVAKVGDQSYRRAVSAESGTEVVLAVVGKQLVATLLASDTTEPQLRQALGLDRPEKNLQDDGRLEKIAKDKGYEKFAVGAVDIAHLLPLMASGKDPLFAAMVRQKMQADAAKTGEPVSAQANPFPPSCEADATRIAARFPSASFGYTRIDPTHQETRFDIALAPDITQAFSGLEVEVPGLGKDSDTPFDFALALPVKQVREFWTAQADAVTAKPFQCPALAGLNEAFGKVGPAMQQAAIPPFGDLRGIRIALDTFTMPPADKAGQIPAISGRILIATSNPAGLVAMGSAVMPALAQVKLTPDGKPVALPADMTAMAGGPGFAAMTDKAVAIGIGAGQDAKLGDMLKDTIGDKGRQMRVHLNGDMYRTWIDLMADKADAMSAAGAGIDPTADPATAEKARADAAARSKAQFDTMRAQAQRIVQLSGDVQVDSNGLIITSKAETK